MAQKPSIAPGTTREQTLALIRSGKTVAETAKIRGLTEGTIVAHLEHWRGLGELPLQDISHLAGDLEDATAKIHDAFAELGSDKLSPVFKKFGGAYSYDQLRLARLLLDGQFTSPKEPPANFEEIRQEHPKAYLPWNELQDEKLRQLFTEGSPVADLAVTLQRTKGAIRSRLTKLELLSD